MPEFQMIKGFDEIQDRVLLEPGTYHAVLSEEPSEQSNKAGTGSNLVLQFETFGDKNPLFNNQNLTVWLAMPKPEDANEMKYGRSVADSKMERILNMAKALGGNIKGSNVTFPSVGKKVRIQVSKDTYTDESTGETRFRNSISQVLPEK